MHVYIIDQVYTYPLGVTSERRVTNFGVTTEWYGKKEAMQHPSSKEAK